MLQQRLVRLADSGCRTRKPQAGDAEGCLRSKSPTWKQNVTNTAKSTSKPTHAPSSRKRSQPSGAVNVRRTIELWQPSQRKKTPTQNRTWPLAGVASSALVLPLPEPPTDTETPWKSLKKDKFPARNRTPEHARTADAKFDSRKRRLSIGASRRTKPRGL